MKKYQVTIVINDADGKPLRIETLLVQAENMEEAVVTAMLKYIGYFCELINVTKLHEKTS